MGLPHRYHPDPEMDDPSDAMLYDDCARCDEQATDLLGLDNQKLHWFWSAMQQIEFDGGAAPRQLTRNERIAVRNMYHMALTFERLTRVWPSPEALLRFSVAERAK